MPKTSKRASLLEALEEEHGVLIATLEKRAQELRFRMPFMGQHKSKVEYLGLLRLITALRSAFGKYNEEGEDHERSTD